MEIFSLRLKWLREQRGLSQKEVAEYISMSPQGYGKIENGQREPNLETLALLAKKLNDSTDFLLGLIHYDKSSEELIRALDDYEENVRSSREFISELITEEPTEIILRNIKLNEKLLVETKRRFEIVKEQLMDRYMEIPKVPKEVFIELEHRNP